MASARSASRLRLSSSLRRVQLPRFERHAMISVFIDRDEFGDGYVEPFRELEERLQRGVSVSAFEF